jgi:hypothetical protein
MSYITLSLALIIIILIGSGILHLVNLKRTHIRIEKLKPEYGISKEAFYKEITVAQGSNFTALAMAGWLMLFVAIGYFYLFIPGEMPFSYMALMPNLASRPVGFVLFGIGIAAFFAAIIFLLLDKLSEKHRNFKLTELYSFYNLSKNRKKYIAMTAPLLWISVFISAGLGTIYPETNPVLVGISFFFLIVSECILVLPIWGDRK